MAFGLTPFRGADIRSSDYPVYCFTRIVGCQGVRSTMNGPWRKRIGFLSFGHWQDSPGSQTRTAADALNQSIELAEAAEEIGIDGAFVRVHHFARQLASPYPLLAAIGARTNRIEIGTAVIDMRYETRCMRRGGGCRRPDRRRAPATGAEPRIARARPERRPQLRLPAAGRADGCRRRARQDGLLPGSDHGSGVTRSDPTMTGGEFSLPIQPQSPGLCDRIWWGSGTRETGRWAAAQGMNLQSSTLLFEDTGAPFGELQAEQIDEFRDAWIAAGREHEPRVSVSRSVLPIVSDEDRLYFGGATRATTSSAGSRARSRALAAVTPASPTRSRRSSPRIRRCRWPTRCC